MTVASFWFNDNALACGLMYTNEPTIFMAWAGEHGANIANGLGMLVEQAAEFFFYLDREKAGD